MEEFKFPKINITQEQWKEIQEFKEEYIKKLRTLTFQQQEANDLLEGGLTSRNLASFRNTYIINAQDSLDNFYPMYVHFNIIKEMIKIVSVKVSFWILNYRAYSTAATEKAAVTSGASSKSSSEGGGGQTSSALAEISAEVVGIDGEGFINAGLLGYALFDADSYNVLYNHDHTVINHDHNIEHNHSIPAHSHDITFGIHEEDNSPTIKFYVSENEGVSYNDIFFGGYDTNKKDLEITSLLEGAGSKLIKFESDVRARLSVQIEIKVDIKAR